MNNSEDLRWTLPDKDEVLDLDASAPRYQMDPMEDHHKLSPLQYSLGLRKD